jgi:hypothetical protein
MLHQYNVDPDGSPDDAPQEALSEVDLSADPHVILYRDLRWINIEAGCLHLSCVAAKKLLTPLDSAPRHDTMLDGALLCESAGGDPEYAAVTGAMYDLIRTRRTLEEAQRQLQNVFTGDLKVQTEDRLARHAAEANALIGVFETVLARDLPRQPHLIRQRRLTALLRDTMTVIDMVQKTRHTIDSVDMDSGLRGKFETHRTTLYQMRSAIRRWRDNPSQKMARHMEHCVTQSNLVRDGLEDLRVNTKRHLQRMGVEFFDRGGNVVPFLTT